MVLLRHQALHRTGRTVMSRSADHARYVVQFPHPGHEHIPGGTEWMPWNPRQKHARKFLRSRGRFVAKDDTVSEGSLVFWGEWEPPSRVIARWPRSGRLPRFLHEPVWHTPRHRAPRHNTDPWVFGKTFLYSNCKQLTPHGTPSALQSLTRGSLILFGSVLDHEFVLDTVFVVADSVRYTPSSADHLDVDDAFRTCTVESLTIPGDKDHRNSTFTLYRGATLEDQVDGMYSFVPARPSTTPDLRFARPAITAPGYVNPASKQSPSGVRRPLGANEVSQVWASVRNQVFDAGCVLGVSLDPVPYADTAPEPSGGYGRC